MRTRSSVRVVFSSSSVGLRIGALRFGGIVTEIRSICDDVQPILMLIQARCRVRWLIVSSKLAMLTLFCHAVSLFACLIQ